MGHKQHAPIAHRILWIGAVEKTGHGNGTIARQKLGLVDANRILVIFAREERPIARKAWLGAGR
jgi:hypothetical protein